MHHLGNLWGIVMNFSWGPLGATSGFAKSLRFSTGRAQLQCSQGYCSSMRGCRWRRSPLGKQWRTWVFHWTPELQRNVAQKASKKGHLIDEHPRRIEKTDQNRSTSNKITWANNCNYSIDCLVCKHQATSWFPARLVTVKKPASRTFAGTASKLGMWEPLGGTQSLFCLLFWEKHGTPHQNPWTSHDCDILNYCDHHLATSRCILFGTEPHFSRLALLKTEITQFFPSDSCGPNVFAANAWLVYVRLCKYIYIYLFTQ